MLLICHYLLSRGLEMAFQILKGINLKKVFNTGLVYLKIIRILYGIFSGTWEFNFFISMSTWLKMIETLPTLEKVSP